MSAKVRKARNVAFGILVAFASPSAFALPGDFDTTFSGGIFDVAISDCSGAATSVAVQHDGRILVGGHSNSGSTCGNSDWSLVRLDADGSLDTTFGGGTGFVSVAVGGNGSPLGNFFGEPEGVLEALVLQSDGRIVGVGEAFDHTGNYDTVHVLRWNSDGSLDAGFGTGGMVETDLGSAGAIPTAVALQNDGGILVTVASRTATSSSAQGVLRYTSTGALDTGFGAGGFVNLHSSLPGEALIVPSLALQTDGRILIGASRKPYDPVVLRLTATGALDTTFGIGGIAVAPTGQVHTPAARVIALAPQPDGTIVGFANSNIGWLFRMRRNGDPDPTFGPRHQSYVRVPYASGPMLVLPTGAIRLYTGPYDTSFHVAGYTSAGAVDAGFVQTGGSTPGESIQPNGSDFVTAMALQPDGRFVASGGSASNDDFAFARYEGDASQLRPKAFSFAGLTGVAPSTLQVSNAATIANLTATAKVPVTITGGSYSINGGAFTTRLGFVANGDQVSVEHTSSATSGASVTTTLRVGGLATPNAPWVVNGSQIVAKFTTTTQ